MDHFLDFIFQHSLIVAYALISPSESTLQWWFFSILAITSVFMVNSFLSFAATNEFEIYFLGIGPTEVRIYFIGLNTFIIYADPVHQYFNTFVRVYAIIQTLGLIFVVWQSHKKLGHLDMATNKNNS